MPNLSTITAGARVTYQGDEYKVRSVDGNVLELAYDTGGFFRLVHMSSVTACPTPAIQTAASLPAPAAGQGEGNCHACGGPAGRGVSLQCQPCIDEAADESPFARMNPHTGFWE